MKHTDTYNWPANVTEIHQINNREQQVSRSGFQTLATGAPGLQTVTIRQGLVPKIWKN